MQFADAVATATASSCAIYSSASLKWHWSCSLPSLCPPVCGVRKIISGAWFEDALAPQPFSLTYCTILPTASNVHKFTHKLLDVILANPLLMIFSKYLYVLLLLRLRIHFFCIMFLFVPCQAWCSDCWFSLPSLLTF